MRFNFSKWNAGGKMIFFAACLAFLSFFFKWVEFMFLSQNGFGQGTVLMFILFLYPLIMLLQEKPLNKIGGYVCAAAGIIGAIMYISSKTTSFFGHTIHAASTGPYVFIAACLLLALGVYKYEAN